jgi:tetratricopeptide (TPR) repeat protein
MGKKSPRALSKTPVAAALLATPGSSVWLGAAGLVVLVLAAYLPVLQAGFVWDDDAHVTSNPTLRSLSGLRSIWFDPSATPQYYPLVHTSFWLEYHAWGLHPLGYHVTNVLLHAANALLLWIVLRRLGVPGAYWAALLFAVHPVHVESVAWISERKNVLSTLCYLGSFLAWLHFWPPEQERPTGPWHFYALTLLLFLGALLSKTVTCSLPAAFLLVRWWKQGRVSVRDLLATAPLFLLGLPLALHTAFLEKYHVGAHGHEWSWSYLERALIAGRALWFYAGKLLWPVPLAFSYPRWQINPTSWWQVGLPIAVVVILLSLYGLRRRLGRGALVVGLFFAGTLLPALGFFDVYPMRYSFVADHFQYLASIGLLVLAGAGIAWTLRRRPASVRYACGGMLVAILGVLTWQQTRIYRNAGTLWTDTLAKNADSWLAYTNRARAYQESGQWQLAIADFTRALELKPDMADVYTNRGAAYQQLGQLDQAIRDSTRAIELDPELATAHANRGMAYQAAGQVQQAIADYTRAVELKPTLASAYVNRGTARQQLGEMRPAIADFTQAIELKPDVAPHLPGAADLAGAYMNRGTAHRQLGELQEAVSDYTRAIELDPHLAAAHSNRGMLYQQRSQPQQALADETRAIELRPDLAEAYSNRGMIYQQLGQAPQASADYSRAIELQPQFVNAYYNRASVEQQLGQWRQALADCTRAIELKPDLAVAFGARGTIHFQLGELEQAIGDYTRAIELEPRLAGAYSSRAMVYQQAGQSERALADYTQALTLQPDSAAVYFERAFLYYQSKQYQAAWNDVKHGQLLGGQPRPELLQALRRIDGSPQR